MPCSPDPCLSANRGPNKPQRQPPPALLPRVTVPATAFVDLFLPTINAPRQQEEVSGWPEGHPEGGRGHSDEKGGGLVGLGMSVLGVMAVGGLVGFGDVWPRGKFQSGTRQPGVR